MYKQNINKCIKPVSQPSMTIYNLCFFHVSHNTGCYLKALLFLQCYFLVKRICTLIYQYVPVRRGAVSNVIISKSLSNVKISIIQCQNFSVNVNFFDLNPNVTGTSNMSVYPRISSYRQGRVVQ